MLQRSPSYITSLPSVDPVAERIRSVLPDRLASRWCAGRTSSSRSRSTSSAAAGPGPSKSCCASCWWPQLPEGYDIDRHFSPRYDPWDQRLCLVPDGDLFRALRRGTAEIVTDTIARFTKSGILLTSGTELPADIIVTATGLNLLMLGGIELKVDGVPVEVSEAMTYKGMMLEDVP